METPTPIVQVGQAAQAAGQSVVKKFSLKDKKMPLFIGIALLVVLAGVGTGWLIAGKSGTGAGTPGVTAPGAKSGPLEAGIDDEKAFPDNAEGLLEEGGISGEGTYHLTRPGGATKTVYLTSTVVDLSVFVGKNVKVWGQTFAGKKAGWLMDVGKIKVIE